MKQSCKYCSLNFEDSKQVEKHIRDIHCSKCQQCDFIIRSEAHRAKHMSVRHSGGYKSKAILPPNRKCDKCDFIISSEEQNKKHMKVRHKEVDKALWVADSVLSNVDFDCL